MKSLPVSETDRGEMLRAIAAPSVETLLASNLVLRWRPEGDGKRKAENGRR